MKQSDIKEVKAAKEIPPLTKRFLVLLMGMVDDGSDDCLMGWAFDFDKEHLSIDISNEDYSVYESALAELCAEYSNDQLP